MLRRASTGGAAPHPHHTRYDSPSRTVNDLPTRTVTDLPDTALLSRARSVAAQRVAPSHSVPGHDPGVIVAECPRTDGETLRVSVQTYPGTNNRSVRVAMWRDAWAVKGKSVTVRRAELAAVIAGLCDAAELLANGAPMPQRDGVDDDEVDL